ncbi:hypothetical protein ACH4N4_30640 [Streptomyces microflavus]|uniref:hypothetical protein n=1 Tax=Streptomyces microflavus TaxID=1919 RepID=UPI0037906643
MPTSPTPADRPAEELRAAAELLRQTATTAGGKPWAADHFPEGTIVRPAANTHSLFRLAAHGNRAAGTPCVTLAVGAHIALMHPGVGLAQAAWLDVAADHARQGFMCCDNGPDHCAEVVTPALAVARQLLGTTEAEDARCICGETACESENCDCDSRTCPVDHAAEETDEEREQREDMEATARAHAAGDHDHCGPTCEAEFPTDHLRNFVIAKGYPGTVGALDELLRRAAAPPAPADRAATLTAVADEVERVFVGELNDERALSLHDALIVLRSKLPCTCARSQGLHAKGCQRYVAGHDLLSPVLRLARAREDLRRLADGAAAGVQPPTSEPGLSYRLEHRHREEDTWRPNTPGIGANWSWQSREKAAQRLAEARDRWPDFEHRLIETTTKVASRVLPNCLACGHHRCDGDGPCGALLDAWQRCTCTATPPAAPAAPEEPQ